MGSLVVVSDGPVGTEIAGLAGSSSVVGDPPQWADDSDATYGRITTWSSGGSRVTAYNACTVMLKTGNYVQPTSVKVRMRLGAEVSDVPYPSKVHVLNPFLGNEDCLTVGGPTTFAPMAPTWVEWTFAPVGGGYAALVSWLAAGQAKLRVQAGLKFGPTASGLDEFRYTRIYEAWVVLEGIPTLAAPLRLFPRRDNRAGPGIRNRRASPARVFPRQR